MVLVNMIDVRDFFEQRFVALVGWREFGDAGVDEIAESFASLSRKILVNSLCR